MSFNEIILAPPGGVAINQWKDGSIHFRVSAQHYTALGDLFEKLAAQCRAYAMAVQAATAAAEQAAPRDVRIEALEKELARLKAVGIPVSVDTKSVPSPAHQLAAAVATKQPVTVAAPGPGVFEVAAAMATRNTLPHPLAAVTQAPIANAPLPPPIVPPQPMLPVPMPELETARVNMGPSHPDIQIPPNHPMITPVEKANTVVREGLDPGGDW